MVPCLYKTATLAGGELPERTKGAASKAVVALVVTMGSNPILSAILFPAPTTKGWAKRWGQHFRVTSSGHSFGQPASEWVTGSSPLHSRSVFFNFVC